MKKLFSVFAAVLAAAISFVSCQKEGENSGENVTPAGGISFAQSTYTIFVGDNTTTLEVNGLEEGEGVSYEVADNTVATVSTKGVVRARKVGETSVTAKSKKDATRTATCTIKVVEKPADYVDITGVTVTTAEGASSATIKEGNKLTLTASISPANATDKDAALANLAWRSSNAAVATVSAQGEVTAVAAGTANIIASVKYTVNGSEITKEGSLTVTVTSANIPATSIQLSMESLNVTVGSTSDLYATILPEDHTDQLTITWESSAPSIASVSDGHVTGKAVGQAVITAKAGKLSATCAVTVVEEVVPVQKKVINFRKVFFPVTFPTDLNGSGSDVLDEVTMETWIKIAGSTANQSIMGVEGVLLLRTESNQWQLIYGGDVKSNQEYEEIKLATSYTADLNKWTHVAAVYSRKNNYVKLYINGVEKGSGAPSAHGVNMNGITKSDGTKVGWKLPFTFIIGNACDGGRYLQGNVAYMRVWGRALTAEQIVAGMNNAAPSTNALLANWKFDDAEGDSVKDSGPYTLTLAPKTYQDKGGQGATAANNIIDSTIEWIDGELPY